MASSQTLVCVKQVKQEAEEEWDETMPLPGDIIEGVTEGINDDNEDKLFIPAKGKSDFSTQLGKISRKADDIWLMVRRGNSMMKLHVVIVCERSSKLQQRKYTVRAASNDKHIAVLADLTFDQCTELQGNEVTESTADSKSTEMSRRVVNVESRGFNQKGIKYDWKTKVGTFLPDHRSTVVSSVLFMPMGRERDIEATTVRTMAWFSAAVSSGVPLVFINIQTEQIITSESANVNGKEITRGRQRSYTTTVQIVQGIRLWFLPGITEVSLELTPEPREVRFGMDIRRTEEFNCTDPAPNPFGNPLSFHFYGFICIYAVTKGTAADRAGLGYLHEKANETNNLVVISRLEGKSLMPTTVSSDGLIHCCDHSDIKETLVSAMEHMDSIQLHVMSWPTQTPLSSPQAIGAATLRPPKLHPSTPLL